MRLPQQTNFPGLNSFFEGHVNKKQTLSLLSQKLSPIKTDMLVLMITYLVVISAVTGHFMSLAGMVLYNSETGLSEHFTW